MGEGFAEITVMVRDYKTMDYGEVMLQALTDLERADYKVSVAAELAVKLADGTEKEVQSFAAETAVTGLLYDVNGDGNINLIELSDMIDAFGKDDSDADWATIYKFMDFNNNNAIDIYDIANVARQI
jgi:hypothetical protein